MSADRCNQTFVEVLKQMGIPVEGMRSCTIELKGGERPKVTGEYLVLSFAGEPPKIETREYEVRRVR